MADSVGFVADSRSRAPANRNDLSECVEVDEIGVVEWADPGLAEPTVDRHRHSAHVDLLAELPAAPAADDDTVRAELPRLAPLKPSQD